MASFSVKNSEVNNASDAVICFGSQYFVFIPKVVTPQLIAEVLRGIRDRIQYTTDYGLIAAKFLNQLSDGYNAKLVRNLPYGSNAVYTITIGSYGGAINVYFVKNGSTVAYTINKFIEWAKTTNGLEEAIGKVVRFNYQGGHKYGNRVVRLEKVIKEGLSISLEGIDLEKGGGYRRFLSDRIKGDVEVLTD